MIKPIPYGKQNITDSDIEAVVKTLKSDYLTQGPMVEKFENRFAKYIGSKYAISVANGTAALHLSIKALGIRPGQKVITSPITFAATANAILYNQGEVEFCDIDPDTLLININQVQEKLSNASKGTYAGIIPVDFAGAPVKMDAFRKLAEEYGVWLLEDACHAPGGSYKDDYDVEQKCGNGAYAHAAIFSFHPVKHIACGEGGMITTNDENLYNRLFLLRSHGITKNPEQFIENHGGWYHEMQELGYNYRLNDIACSLGVSQLKRAEEGLKKRKDIAKRYFYDLSKVPEIKMINENNYSHAYHLFVIQVDRRKELYDYLKEKNIFTQVHYVPVHYHPYYRNLGYKKGDYPHAESYYQKCLSLPIYPTLSKAEQNHIIKSINYFFNGS